MTTEQPGDTCVARVPIFRGLDATQQAEVAGFATPVDATAGDQVMGPGDQRRRLFVVHSGNVRVVRLSESGREHVLRVLGEGDVVGEDSFVLGRRPSHHVYADNDVRLCTFDHADLAKLVTRFPGIAVRMLQVQSERLSAAERMLTAMGGADVGARLAAYLLDLPSRQGDGGAAVELPMAKKDVASHLGTSPETLSRRLREFIDGGIIELDGRTVLIRDVEALILRATPR